MQIYETSYKVWTFRDIDIRFFYKQKCKNTFWRFSKIVNTNAASCCCFFVSQIATMPLRSSKSIHWYGTIWFSLLISLKTALPFVKICVALLKISNLSSEQIVALPGSWTILLEDNCLCLLEDTSYLALSSTNFIWEFSDIYMPLSLVFTCCH